MGKWIYFEEHLPLPKHKTKRFNVITKDAGDSIGTVAWYGPWRKYCFFPHVNTVFEQDCLRDIADFIEKETKEHKKNWYKG